MKTEPKLRFHLGENQFSIYDLIPFNYYVRVSVDSPTDAEEAFRRFFDRVEPVPSSPAGVAEFICGAATRRDLSLFLSSFGGAESVIRLAE